MYAVYCAVHIHHLLNEPKEWIFAYNSNWRVYMIIR